MTVGLQAADSTGSCASGTLTSDSTDKTIVLWNIELGERVLVITDLVDPVLSIAFSPHGQRIVYCCCDSSIQDTTAGAVFGTLISKDSKITIMAYSPSDDLTATRDYDNSLGIWDFKSLECLLVVRGVARNTNSVSWSLVDDQLRLATVSSEGIVWRWSRKAMVTLLQKGVTGSDWFGGQGARGIIGGYASPRSL
ncbi:MAG: WD40-repeat-containing domain protein [Linnemannia gamsii]|nr:MAG: WD40-repeat-containing domain protein [Linnemannia gamsii]